MSPSELSTKKAQVGVITSNRRILRHVARALAAADWEVVECAFDRGAIADDLAEPRRIYLIDGDEPLDEVQWTLRSINQAWPDAQAVVLFHEREGLRAPSLMASSGLRHFIGRQAIPDLGHTLIDEEELIASCRKLIDSDIFGLEKYLSTWGVVPEHVRLTEAGESSAAIDKLQRFLERIDCPSRIRPLVLRSGEALLASTFSEELEVPGVDLRFACDGWNVGISVGDSNGAISSDEIVDALAGDPHATGPGSALLTVFCASTQLVVNIEPGKRSEIIAIFCARMDGLRTDIAARSVNVFKV